MLKIPARSRRVPEPAASQQSWLAGGGGPERSEGSCAGRRGRDASAVVPGGAWNPVAPDPNVGVSGLELGGLL